MTVATVTRRMRAEADRSRTGWIALALVGLLVVAVHLWGRGLQAGGHRLFLNLPPLVGHLEPRFAASGLGALPLGVAAVVWGPAVAERLPWRRLLPATAVAAAAWAVTLAFTEGVDGVLRSPAGPSDYLNDAPLVGSPSAFLAGFVQQIERYTTHVRAHPPGMTLLAWSVWRAGGSPAWMAGLEIAAAASAVPAVLLAIREVSGERRARTAAPFLAFAPVAITMASSGDAFFAGVGAWAVALVVLATGREGPRADVLALAGGFLFGVTAFLSYGLVLLGAIPLMVAVGRRRLRAIGLAALGALPVFVGFSWAGFWWVEGLLATRLQYLASAARSRPYSYFVVANLAAFALVLGPAAVSGLAVLRERSTWWLVGGALGAAVLADLSGMSKAEVERIWLPFAVWVLPAAVGLPERSRRSWLVATVGYGLALEVAVRQPW